jgi:hypothetical protein
MTGPLRYLPLDHLRRDRRQWVVHSPAPHDVTAAPTTENKRNNLNSYDRIGIQRAVANRKISAPPEHSPPNRTTTVSEGDLYPAGRNSRQRSEGAVCFRIDKPDA